MAAAYEKSVFLNVPFDDNYERLSDALVFSIRDCGFIARSAREVDDSGQARILKILDVIEQSKYGIHDISRAGIDSATGLARFNMPLELGFFLGAQRYGTAKHRQKRCMVLDREPYRYRDFCSDIAGQDVRAHHDHPRYAIRAVRDWLSTHRTTAQLPGGKAIFDRYELFRAQRAVQAAKLHLDPAELTFGDYTMLVTGWLDQNPW